MTRHIITLGFAILAGLGAMLGQGHVSLPPLAAVGGIFALAFLRRWPGWLGVLVFTVVFTAASEIAYRGTVPLPVLPRLGVMAAGALPLAFVFLVQSRATDRRPGLLTALILPAGMVGLDLLQATFSPTGTWGSLAYGFLRPGLLPFTQVAAAVGWLGLTFLLGWSASMGDLLLRRFRPEPAAVLVGVLALVWVGGALRLARAPEPESTFTTAMVHGPTLMEMADGELIRAHYLGWGMDDDQRARVPAAIAAYRDAALEQLAAQAGPGVDLVATAEVLGWVGFDDEEAWLDRVRELARTSGTVFALGLGVYDPSRERNYENKLVIVDADGEVRADYLKARATPGAWHVVGDGILPQVAMPWGTLGGAICFDLDFPGLLRQAGRGDSRVVLAPSFDDDRVRFMHARMAAMRAVEQGFTLVRPTAFGISAVVDPYGRAVAEKDAYAGGGFVLRAEVPVYHVPTPYGRFGDVFGWVCLAGFGVLAILRTRKKA